MAVMRASHKSVRRVYLASPRHAEDNTRTVYTVAHHQPCVQRVIVTRFMQWLPQHAKWQGSAYTDAVMLDALQPEEYDPTWCTNIHLRRVRNAAS